MSKFYIYMLFSTICFTLQAQTLYFVPVIATGDETDLMNNNKNRDAFQITLNELNKTTEEIAYYLKINYKNLDFSGENFQFNKVLNSLKNLYIQENDIVIIWFVAHGKNVKDLKSNYPAPLISNTINKDSFLPFEKYITNFYDEKRPRLMIAVIDSCNDEQDIQLSFDNSLLNQYRLLTPNIQNYYQYGLDDISTSDLFLKSTGLIIFSAASKGEKARLDTQKGAVFSMSFINDIKSKLVNNQHVNFINLLEKFKNDFTSIAKSRNIIQTPFYRQKIEIKDKIVISNNNVIIENEKLTTLIRIRELILNGKLEDARTFLLSLLKKEPNNEDFKMAVFIIEVSMGYDHFTTIDNSELYQIIGEKEKFKSKEYSFLQYLVGVSYLKGVNGYKKNWDKAIYWLKLSFNNGNYIGACKLLTILGVNECYNILYK